MNDAFWDFFEALDNADINLHRHFDRYSEIYQNIPEDIRGDFANMRRRLENCKEIMNESAKLLQKVKEKILENN